MPPGRSRTRWIVPGALVLAGGAALAWRIEVRRDEAVPTRARVVIPTPPPARTTVAITGTVRELGGGPPVGNARVVVRGAAGEATAITASDGGFTLRVAPGRYHVWVDGPRHVSVVAPGRVRLPDAPEDPIVGVPDEALLPVLEAYEDVGHLELAVARTGTLTGRVRDPDGRPLATAVVRALGPLRPATGQDHVRTDAEGRYELRLPPGRYVLDVTHERIGGPRDALEVQLAAGRTTTRDLSTVAGCVVTGRVIDGRGAATTDGAIERRLGPTERAFGPAGRIRPGGTFRWATIDEGEITLRAWPWRSPPSPARAFACTDGARHDGVVFQLPDEPPVLAGTLVDATGAPVPFTYVDIAALDDDGLGQQERTDAEGRWHVYHLPPGRYRVTAQTASGVVHEVVTAPRSGLELRAGGTGRLEGTTSTLGDGSLEIIGVTCTDHDDPIEVAFRRLVPVREGRFAVDGLPACRLLVHVQGHAHVTPLRAELRAGEVVVVDLALGPPVERRVRGVVRDRGGAPVEGAVVTASGERRRGPIVRTDAQGRFTLTTGAGATLTASARDRRVGHGRVGQASVDAELVEIVLGR